MKNLLILLLLLSFTAVHSTIKRPDYKDARVIICGCAKNVENHLPRVFENCIDPLKLFFKDYKIIIVENDSKDNTLAYLKDLRKKDSKIIIITENNLNTKIKGRTQRLAYCRNKYMNYARTHFNDYDYLVVLDLDNRPVQQTKIDLNKLKYFFKKNDDWEALSLGSPYFDIWALRSTEHPYNCWNRKDAKEYVRRTKKDIQERLQNISEFNFLEVESAFNGFAIYYFPKTKQCYYDGNNREPLKYISNDCEHVAFHRDMREKNNARIVISPLSIF